MIYPGCAPEAAKSDMEALGCGGWKIEGGHCGFRQSCRREGREALCCGSDAGCVGCLDVAVGSPKSQVVAQSGWRLSRTWGE